MIVISNSEFHIISKNILKLLLLATVVYKHNLYKLESYIWVLTEDPRTLRYNSFSN